MVEVSTCLAQPWHLEIQETQGVAFASESRQYNRLYRQRCATHHSGFEYACDNIGNSSPRALPTSHCCSNEVCHQLQQKQVQLSEGPGSGGCVCHRHLRYLWPLSLLGWDIDIDQIVCVAHIELTAGICRVSYLGTMLSRVLLEFYINSTFQEK